MCAGGFDRPATAGGARSDVVRRHYLRRWHRAWTIGGPPQRADGSRAAAEAGEQREATRHASAQHSLCSDRPPGAVSSASSEAEDLIAATRSRADPGRPGDTPGDIPGAARRRRAPGSRTRRGGGAASRRGKPRARAGAPRARRASRGRVTLGREGREGSRSFRSWSRSFRSLSRSFRSLSRSFRSWSRSFRSVSRPFRSVHAPHSRVGVVRDNPARASVPRATAGAAPRAPRGWRRARAEAAARTFRDIAS